MATSMFPELVWKKIALLMKKNYVWPSVGSQILFILGSKFNDLNFDVQFMNFHLDLINLFEFETQFLSLKFAKIFPV